MQLTELSHDGALDMLERILNTLYPGGDPDSQWSPDTLDSIAQVFRDYDIKPLASARPAMLTDSEYVRRGGGCCPFCRKDEDFDLCAPQSKSTGDILSQHVTCRACGRSYQDLYELTGYEPVDEGPRATKEALEGHEHPKDERRQ